MSSFFPPFSVRTERGQIISSMARQQDEIL
nr:MAG TPA: hypothetical protein [Caudoviricetes sp.]